MPLWLLLSAGCASTSGPTGPSDLGTGPGDQGVPAGQLKISPDPVLITTSGEAKTAALTVTSSSAGNVTDQVSWMLSEPALGTVQRGVLTTTAGITRGYRATLTATYQGVQMGTASVIVKLLAPDYLDPQAPRDPATFFGNDVTGPKPAWLYPLAGAMLPRNLDPLSLQFSGAAGAVVYRIQAVCTDYVRAFYLTSASCTTNNCLFVPLPPDWRDLAASCAGDTVMLSLAASPGQGKPIGTDGPLGIGLSPDDLKGGLYYFNASIMGLYRTVAGSAQRQVYLNRGNAYGCAGCHAVSRDGSKVALSFSAFYPPGDGGVVDGQNGQRYVLQPPAAGKWELASFSPKGDMLLVNYQGKAQVIDPVKGDVLYTVPQALLGGLLIEPEWSPDGQSIVFVRVATLPGNTSYSATDAGDIMLMPFNNGKFAVPEVIVPAQPGVAYHFHPSWTPDSQWILFNTGQLPCLANDAHCPTYGPTNTLLQIVRAVPGSTPVNLLNARQKAGSSTDWPRAVPYLQSGDQLLFFSFATRATYGFLKTDALPNLWMSAIDLDKLVAQPGQDPSFPPFWVPGQQPGETNVLGAWTTQLGCGMSADCPNGFICQGGQCIAQVQ